jgi:superoxide dismutase
MTCTSLSLRAKSNAQSNALEPVISAEIMRLHHTKHHQAYVTNLNMTEEKLGEAKAKNDLASAIALQGALRFNGGGTAPDIDVAKKRAHQS